MSPGAWDALDLVLCLLFAAGSFYYYVSGSTSRTAPCPARRRLLFLVFFAGAVVFLVRVLR